MCLKITQNFNSPFGCYFAKELPFNRGLIKHLYFIIRAKLIGAVYESQ